MSLIQTASRLLLTELEMQQGVVNRDMQKVDEARSQLEETQAAQRHNAGELARAEDELNQTTDAAREKEISEAIKSIKNTVAAQNAQEQERSAIVQRAQEELRDAQQTLDRIEDDMSSIVKR